jgi:CheY-like chemotaxis protein
MSADSLEPLMKEPPYAPFKGLHMLVVDDEADTLEMLRTFLVNTHAEVTACANAGEASEVLRLEKRTY